MTTTLKNLVNTSSESIVLSKGPTALRPAIRTVVEQFTSVGTTTWTAPAGVTAVEVLVVAGGGGGGNAQVNSGTPAGGGGAGGLIYNSDFAVTPSTSYTVTVGVGGAGSTSSSAKGTNGGNSVFATLTAIGGGGGGSASANAGENGGSGGGTCGTGSGGVATANQGNNGSGGSRAGGGGGAGAPGVSGFLDKTGDGGAGVNFNISGTSTWYAGGGGAGGSVSGFSLPGGGGLGGGGQGASSADANGGTNGTANTGGGGGGGAARAGSTSNGGAGGSGIVVIRYSITSDNEDSRGLIRYNTELRDVEVYENTYTGWTAQDSTRNFAGHNLVLYSEQFENAYWSKANCSITQNSITSPYGDITGDLITLNSTNGFVFRSLGIPSAGTWTLSVYLKAGTQSTLNVTVDNVSGASAGGTEATFDLSNVSASVGTQSGSFGGTSNGSARIINVGDGWYRCSLTVTVTNSANTAFGIRTGSEGQTFYAWGTQLEQAMSAGPYVRTVDAISPIPTSLGGYRTHTYTATGTSGFTPACSGTVEVLVVAGGGGGAGPEGGGGGAGGLIYNSMYLVESNRTYTVTVGAGGTGNTNPGGNGGNSVFATLTAIGGGGGGQVNNNNARTGGSGGGGGRTSSVRTFGGGQVSTQGNPGGTGFENIAGFATAGGGGAGTPGGNGLGLIGGAGGTGILISISGTPTYYAGGGGGGGGNNNGNPSPGLGGLGGGGTGGPAGTSTTPATAGTANTGGGGGGGGQSNSGAAGGSGIVIVRYRYD
jgi:hypothetical protein